MLHEIKLKLHYEEQQVSKLEEKMSLNAVSPEGCDESSARIPNYLC